MRDIIILGGGLGAKQAIETLVTCNEKSGSLYNIIGILDDDAQKKGSDIWGYKVLGNMHMIHEFPEASVVWGIGSPKNPTIRLLIENKLALSAERYESLIHPGSDISKHAKNEEGITICRGVLVAADVHISRHVGIGMGTIVEHDTSLSPGVLLAAGVLIAGNVTVGQGSYIGQGANIKEWIKIGMNSIIGMGAVVIHDVPDNSTVVGNPAKILNR